MAKNEITIPDAEFKSVFEPATAEAAYDAITDAKEGVLMLVPLDAIHPIAGFNIRVNSPENEAFLERTKESIKANGFFRHRPLKVFPAIENGQPLLYLADGYGRFEAAKRAVAEGAKLRLVPVVATPKGTSMDDLFVGLDADNDSRPLTAFEKGILVKRMLADGNDEDEIANKLHITKQYVGDLVLLMSAPKGLHNMVVSGQVAASLAIDLIKEHGSGKKALDSLKDAGASPDAPSGGNGAAAPRVTRSQVGRTGGTAKAGKKLYEALIEYMIVLNSSSGSQAAMDFLIRWNEKEAAAVKELEKLVAKKPKKGGKASTKPDKDTRIPIKKSMSEEEKEKARKHNKRVKTRAEKRAKAEAEAAAAAAAGGTPSAETPPANGAADNDPV